MSFCQRPSVAGGVAYGGSVEPTMLKRHGREAMALHLLGIGSAE
jgi:hypothetical protein